MKKTCFAIVSLLLVFVQAPMLRADDNPLPQPVMMVIGFLQLSDSQANDLVRIIRERDAAIQPIAQNVQADRDALARLLDTQNPDPAKAGQLLIQIHEGEKDVAQHAQTAAASFLATLNDDQRQRMQVITMAAQVAPVIPAFKALGLI